MLLLLLLLLPPPRRLDEGNRGVNSEVGERMEFVGKKSFGVETMLLVGALLPLAELRKLLPRLLPALLAVVPMALFSGKWSEGERRNLGEVKMEEGQVAEMLA